MYATVLLWSRIIALTLFSVITSILFFRFILKTRYRDLFYFMIMMLLLSGRIIFTADNYLSFILLVTLVYFSGKYLCAVYKIPDFLIWEFGNGLVVVLIVISSIFSLYRHRYFFIVQILILVLFHFFQTAFLLRKMKIILNKLFLLLWLGKIGYLAVAIYDIMADHYGFGVNNLTVWFSILIALYVGFLILYRDYILFPGSTSYYLNRGDHRTLYRMFSQIVKTENLIVLQDKLIRVGLLSTGILHELKNTFFAIGTAVDFALHQQDVASKDRSLGLIRESIEKGKSFTGRILADLKLTEPSPERVALSLELPRLIKLVKANYRSEGIIFKHEIAENLALYAGKSDLEQIIFNLIWNSVAALKKQQQDEKVVTLKAWQDGDKIIIDVMDNGPGVPENLMHHLFEPAVSGMESTGLGLYIADLLVRRNNGILEYYPGAGGAHFRLILRSDSD